MTKPPAMPEPLGWYVVNNIGMATLCADEAEAQLLAEDCDMVYQRQAPHRAVQLVALAALQSAQPAEVSDAEIERVLALAHNYADAKLMRYGQLGIKDLPDPQVAFDDLKRAILALRPQAVPMTVEQVARSLASAPLLTQIARVDRYEVMQLVRAVEAHHGITQRADGEEVE